MKRLMSLSVVMALALAGTGLLASSAGADALPTITFEQLTYLPGSINGQDGWSATGPYDQEVDTSSSVAGFGAQSFRMSNAVSSGSFGDWPFSPSLIDEAGETGAEGDGSSGTLQNHFEASFQIASAVPTIEQPGLGLAFSPDRGDGARMSLVRVRDLPAGLQVSFVDYQSNGIACDGDFVDTIVASGLNRSTVHSIRIAMDFVDGVRNDIVNVYVDGTFVHTGTSWEDYFRECEGNSTRTVDSLLFRASGTASSTLGNGFLIDNLTLSSSLSTPCVISTTAGPPTVYTLLADCTTDHTMLVPQNVGGSVFNGNGHTITGVDPVGSHFVGAVIQAQPGTNNVTVTNLGVTVSLADVCDADSARLRGILFDAVGGSITNNDVIGLKQGTNSGCQEGNAIEVRNAPFSRGGPDKAVSITGNTVTDYQKTGIIANGSVNGTITDNVVTGAGPITYIAQNGIQVGFGATALVRGNTVSANWYTPTDTIACGLLLFDADGVKLQMNRLFNNEVNTCKFGRGGGSIKPSP